MTDADKLEAVRRVAGEWVAPGGSFDDPAAWPEDMRVQEFPR